ncbi:hypothetical protein ABZ570_19670 [Micromonospora sp. NPDC007271]|uniref:hypothetical protein n=1 Tax=Micromonospora sp. NPDC007271 TaxID=3154587 RepID=UPI0033D54533
MTTDEKLPLADVLALQQLAYLRQRSLGSTRYRATGQLWLQVTPRELHWSRPSVFDPHLDSIRRSLATFERLAHRRDPGAENAWQAVLAAVDLLLAEARQRAGHRIRPRRA